MGGLLAINYAEFLTLLRKKVRVIAQITARPIFL